MAVANTCLQSLGLIWRPVLSEVIVILLPFMIYRGIMKFGIQPRNKGRERFKIEGRVYNLLTSIIFLNFLAQFLN